MLTAYDIDDDDARSWPLLPVLMALTAIWLVLGWPWLSGSVTIPWDGKAHFAPQVQFLAQSLARGEAPWWTPFVFSGHPQIADPQAMIFSPPMLLLAAVDAAPSLRAIDTTVLATVLFGGFGVVAWGRGAGWHWAAAMAAALVFMFGGSMAWRLQHFGQVMSLAYLPFAFVAIRVALRDGSVVAGIVAGVLAAAILLGRDQVGLLSVYVLAAFAVAQLLGQPGQRTDALRRAALPAVAGAVVAVALVAVPLVLTLLLAAQSNRPSIDLAGAHAGSLHPALLLTAVTANFYGSAGEMASFWGPPSFAWADTGLFTAQNMGVVYLSMAGLCALLYGGFRGMLVERGAAFFSAAAAVMLVYAIGRYTPAFAVLYELVPGVDKFRRPADATFLLCGLLAFPIGHVIDRTLREAEAGALRFDRSVMLTGSALLVLVAGLVAMALWRDRIGQAAPEIATAIMATGLTAGIVAAALWLLPIRPVLAAGLVVGWIAFDLGQGNGPNGASALPPSTVAMLDTAVTEPTIAWLENRIAELQTPTRRERAELAGLGYHWPNAGLTHGIETTLGTNPVRLDWYARATGASDTVATAAQRGFSPLMPSYDAPLADLLGLRFVVTPASELAALTERTRLTEVARIGDTVILENAGTLPRVVFADRAEAVGVDALLAHGDLPAADFTRTVLLDDREVGQMTGGVPTATPPASKLVITRYENTTVEVAVESERDGWLVLHDTWHPWWQVMVDGSPARLLRANVIFRGVAVPAGRHTVTFQFAPIGGAIDQLLARTPGGNASPGTVVASERSTQ